LDASRLVDGNDESRFQVVSLPLHSDDLQAALHALAESFGGSGNRVVAVCGVTGGSGATTLTLNLAYELAAERHLRCLMVDLSFQMGVLATNLNIEPQFTIQDVLKDVSGQHLYAVQKALTRVTDKLHMIAGPHQAVMPMQVKAQDVLEVIRLCRRLAEWTLLDVPCTYDDLYFKILAAADRVIMVAEQRVPSIRAAKLICDRLCPDVDPEAMHLVVNRYDPKMKGFRLDELRKLLPVGHLSGLANDPESVIAAVNQGRPLHLQAPHSPALADIDALCDGLVGKAAATALTTGDFSVLGRLARTFGLL
jgi:pilus assembly protein CpaE